MRKDRASFVVAVMMVLGAVGAIAQVGGQPPDATKAPPAGKKDVLPQSSQTGVPGAGLVVFIDPVTGRIRQPEPGEIGKLVGPPPVTSLTVRPLEVRYGPGGMVGVMLDSSFDSYMVVSKQPDGTLSMQCVTGDPKANAAVAAGPGAAPPSTAAKAPRSAGKREAPDVQ
jgi:hypothetical protein